MTLEEAKQWAVRNCSSASVNRLHGPVDGEAVKVLYNEICNLELKCERLRENAHTYWIIAMILILALFFIKV